MLLNKSLSQPTVLFRFTTQVSVTRPGHLVNTTMAEVIRAWQDYLSQPLDDSDASTDSSDLLALAVKQLIETLGTFSYDDILLRTQAVNCILFMLCVEFVMPRLGALSDDAV